MTTGVWSRGQPHVRIVTTGHTAATPFGVALCAVEHFLYAVHLTASTTCGLIPCLDFQWDKFTELTGHGGGRSYLPGLDMGAGIGVTTGWSQ